MHADLCERGAGVKGQGSELLGMVLSDLARRQIPDLIPCCESEPARVIFSRGDFSTARVYLGRLSRSGKLELIFVAHAINAIRIESDKEPRRVVVPVAASSLSSMFCALWLTFRRAQVTDRGWSLHGITRQYPDVTSTPSFGTPIRAFGRLVFGLEDLRLPHGLDVRLPAHGAS